MKRKIVLCLRCGRKLRDKKSKQRGYGAGCWRLRPSLAYRDLEKNGQLTFEVV